MVEEQTSGGTACTEGQMPHICKNFSKYSNIVLKMLYCYMQVTGYWQGGNVLCDRVTSSATPDSIG